MASIANLAEGPAVAVIADAHVYDMASDYGTGGVLLNGISVLARSWEDTRAAARVYNESRASLEAALDMVLQRGIRHVVLLGDYTDDGQRAATQRLAALLRSYQGRLAFYALPGNHDLYASHGKHQSMRAMAAAGGTVLVTSDPELATGEAGSILSAEMFCQGSVPAIEVMAEFGLFRRAEYLHWETPFGLDDAVAARSFDARSSDGLVVQRQLDASYLVEPQAGLWLLMIDANVFEPRNGRLDPARKQAFHDPSDAGWNAVLRVKPHLLPWIADVCGRAKAAGTRLLAFSHYPVVDPYEDASGSEAALFGDTEVRRRTPLPEVAVALRDAGLRHVFSGHLHANGMVQAGGLSNVAVPSLVSFPPGFKTVTQDDAGLVVETVSLGALGLNADLAALYGVDFAEQRLGGMLRAQIRNRVLERTVRRDWPDGVASWALGASVGELRAIMGAVSPDPLDGMPLAELIADWYGLRQAGGLAREYIDADRLSLYARLAGFGDQAAQPGAGLHAFFARFLAVLAVSLRRMSRPEQI